MQRNLTSSLLLGLVLVSLGGCADENALSGSLSDFYNVSFDGVRARLYPTELAIEYIRENGEVPVRVTIEVDEGERLTTRTYTLPEKGGVTGRSGTNDIPPLDTARIELEEYAGADGTPIVGTFDASFLTGDDTTSLNGVFDTTLEVVSATEGYEIDGFTYGPDCDNPYMLRSGVRFIATLDANDEDAVGGLCFDGVDTILAFELEEGREVEFRLDLDNGVGATLQSGECGFGEQVACYSGRGPQTMRLEPGLYFLVVEGEGKFSVEVVW